MSEFFVTREYCPCCKGIGGTTLYEAEFIDSPIKEYLDRFYSLQGGIEWEYLRDAHYVLVECVCCELIYQKQILNEFLMSKLYEQWIDPVKVFERNKGRYDVGYFLNYTKQIVNVILFLNTLPSKLRFLDFRMGWGYSTLFPNALGC